MDTMYMRGRKGSVIAEDLQPGMMFAFEANPNRNTGVVYLFVISTVWEPAELSSAAWNVRITWLVNGVGRGSPSVQTNTFLSDVNLFPKETLIWFGTSRLFER